MKEPFHNNDYEYEWFMRRLARPGTVLDANRQKYVDWANQLFSESLSRVRVAKYMTQLHTVERFLRMPFEDATIDDIKRVVREIEQHDYKSSYKHDLKVTLKKFYKWLRGTEDYPPEVRWFRTGIKASQRKLPEELLTENDVKKMIEVAEHPRDKAFVAVLYESGCRVGEVGTLHLRNVQFDEYGAQIIVAGKTGMRRVRLVASSPYLAAWMDCHPRRGEPDAPLWTIILGTINKTRGARYASLSRLLRFLAAKADVNKHVYPHLFRHSRATALADKLTDAQLKEMFGWTQSSAQAATYIHLSGRNVDDALLKLHGLKRETDSLEQSALKLRKCTRCERQNQATATLCNRCGMPLDVKEALRAEGERREWDSVMSKLVADPEVQAVLARKLREMNLRPPC